ncbi:MAG: hypothetical protein HFI82_01575 [Eubacterium sp.]|jgi:hypothetical protein|nr:hypothetical protein [Eubacterium sp.]
MELNGALDYFIAISGILIIVISFVWNIYEVFIHKTTDASHAVDSADSTIR